MAFSSDRAPSMHDFAPSWLKIPPQSSSSKQTGGRKGEGKDGAAGPPHPSGTGGGGGPPPSGPYSGEPGYHQQHAYNSQQSHPSHHNHQYHHHQSSSHPQHHQYNSHYHQHHPAPGHHHSGSGALNGKPGRGGGPHHQQYQQFGKGPHYHHGLANGNGSSAGTSRYTGGGGPAQGMMGGGGGHGMPAGGGPNGPITNHSHHHKYMNGPHRTSHPSSSSSIDSSKPLKEEDFPSLNGGGPLSSAAKDQHQWSWGKQDSGGVGGTGAKGGGTAGGPGEEGTTDGDKMYRSQVKRIARRSVVIPTPLENQDNRGLSLVLGEPLSPPAGTTDAVTTPTSALSDSPSPPSSSSSSAPITIPNGWGSPSAPPLCSRPTSRVLTPPGMPSLCEDYQCSAGEEDSPQLSMSLEKEHKLMREMGWKEAGSSDEEEVWEIGEKERSQLTQLQVQARNARRQVLSKVRNLTQKTIGGGPWAYYSSNPRASYELERELPTSSDSD